MDQKPECPECHQPKQLIGGVVFIPYGENEVTTSDLYKCRCGLKWTRDVDFERDEILD